MFRNFLFLSILTISIVSCSPTEKQKQLVTEIEKSLQAIEQEVIQFEGTATYLAKEQAEFEEINAKLKKERKGKVDSLYNSLVKEHRKVVDAHSENLEKAKSATEGMKSLLEKLRQPLNFTHNTEYIEEDYTHFDVQYVESKPIMEKSMEEHEKLEKDFKARLAMIEEEKKIVANTSVAKVVVAAKKRK